MNTSLIIHMGLSLSVAILVALLKRPLNSFFRGVETKFPSLAFKYINMMSVILVCIFFLILPVFVGNSIVYLLDKDLYQETLSDGSVYYTLAAIVSAYFLNVFQLKSTNTHA